MLALLAAVWFRSLLLLAGSALVAIGLRPTLGLALLVPGAALVLLGLGGFILPDGLAFWSAVLGASALFGLAVTLLISGYWNTGVACGAAALLLVGLGGLLLPQSEAGLADLAQRVGEMRLRSPWWLLLLLLVPSVVLLSWDRLNRHEVRPWVALGLRVLGVSALALALAEPFFSQATRAMTVLFVVDRSLSVPEEPGKDQDGKRVDLRARRVIKFIKDSVLRRGPGHERDQAGLIVFARRARLELPPSDTPRFPLGDKLPTVEDGDATDISAALKLALASFTEGSARRIVLISDGNQNVGDAEEVARLAKALGVQIDVLPVAVGKRNKTEVMVERVDAPAVVEVGAKVPIRVFVRSHNPNTVVGRLVVRQFTDDVTKPVKEVARDDNAHVHLGLNPFEFQPAQDDKITSCTYEAEFTPLHVLGPGGKKEPVVGDRVENNRASAHVVARGQGEILLLERKPGEHRELVRQLVNTKEEKFRVVALPVDKLADRPGKDRLMMFLSKFDCVVLANVPRDRVSDAHMEAIRDNTRDQGCGLVMIGGDRSFGQGGWQDTPVEEALPVDCSLKSLKVQGKGGLVMIMHASEMADGNRWQKIIAKLAVQRLGPNDEVGIIDYGFGCKWPVPMQEAGPNKRKILAAIDGMMPGDMPDFDPALKMAFDALSDPKKDFGAKHIIIISDGDPTQTDKALLAKIKGSKITIATVGVATHGAPQDAAMAEIATPMPGDPKQKRYYKVTDPKKLPAIYIKETRLVTQAFLHKKPFPPNLRFITEPLKGFRQADFPNLGGFVRTTPKASPLVQVPMITPLFAEQDFPVLAHWQYGLGKSVAFTSDAGGTKPWSREWMDKGVHGRFWKQVLKWSLRPAEKGLLRAHAEMRDGKLHVVVEAKDEKGRPVTNLKLRPSLTMPGEGGRPGAEKQLRFSQKAGGVYEAEVRADRTGSYFIRVGATRLVPKMEGGKVVLGKDGKPVQVEEDFDGVRAGVALPYSREFSEPEANEPLMESIREITGGARYHDDEDALEEAARSGTVFREPETRARFSLPFHYWLLFLAAALLLADVAARRIAFDPNETAEVLGRMWAHLRGLPVPPPTRKAADRLSAKPGGAKRYEGAPGPTLPAQGPARPAPARPAAAAPEAKPDEAAGDAMEALRRAKKKLWGKKEGE